MRTPRGVLWAILVAVVATGSTSASAAPPNGKNRSAATSLPADVETAEQLYAKLDYDRANDVAARAAEQPHLSHDELVRIYRVLAVTYAIVGKDGEARDAFAQLLVFDPSYTVDPNLGPKVSAPFLEARGQFRSLPSKPGIDVGANLRTEGGRLRITIRDPTHVVKKIAVGYRWSSADDYTISELDVGNGIVEVAPATSGRTRLDFYAQALDERGSVVFEAGNAHVPKSLFVEASPRPIAPAPAPTTSRGSVLSSPLFWLFTGAAVVGGGAAAYFAVRPDLPPTKAWLTPALRCGSDPCN